MTLTERNWMKTIYRRKGESIDSLIKRYKRARGKEGIKEAIQKHEVFRSQSQKRRQKHKAAMIRAAKQ